MSDRTAMWPERLSRPAKVHRQYFARFAIGYAIARAGLTALAWWNNESFPHGGDHYLQQATMTALMLLPWAFGGWTIARYALRFWGGFTDAARMVSAAVLATVAVDTLLVRVVGPLTDVAASSGWGLALVVGAGALTLPIGAFFALVVVEGLRRAVSHGPANGAATLPHFRGRALADTAAIDAS